jgi:hypothetical protein
MAGQLLSKPIFDVFDSNGDPINAATATFYLTTTTTLASIYANAELDSALLNPLAADAAGLHLRHAVCVSPCVLDDRRNRCDGIHRSVEPHFLATMRGSRVAGRASCCRETGRYSWRRLARSCCSA